MAAMAGGAAQIADMKLVLLGCRLAGKSSSGNTILGGQEFDTSRSTFDCGTSQRDTAGRHITVVEAPGWRAESSVENTSERHKQEIVRSVSLCPPGPDALLLVLRVDQPFTEPHRRAVEEHMELLGGNVWNDTITLFTRGGWLGDKSIEQHIESAGEALQWVLEKCGNRYHVLDNKKSGSDQVTGLLTKIEKMVARNKQCLFGTLTRQQAGSKHNPTIRDSGYEFECSKTESQSPDAEVTQSERIIPFVSKIPLVEEDAIQVKDLIDQGLFGSVYQGSYQGTPVAVKKMLIGECPTESIIPMHLSHPHIVKMIAVSRKENQLLVAYEYIHGANLLQVIHTQCKIKLTEKDKLWVALEIGMAVEYMHGNHVIHQDINPLNILVSERSKKAYLTDWGLSNMKDSLAEFGVSASGSMCGPQSAGTPLYMAPELLLHNERCTTMSDMWSLGLTYLEMFTDSVPWTLHNSSALIGALYQQEPPHALAKLQPHLTDIVEPLVQYKPQSRLNATALVTRLKSKVDLIDGGTYETPRKQTQSQNLPPKLSDGGYVSQDLKKESQSSAAKKSHLDSAKEITTKIPFVNDGALKIKEFIAKGSFGSVYRGSYQGTPVAVKKMAISKCPANTLELVIPLRLFHPNIVKMLAVSKKEHNILIAYEYIHGANLNQIIHKNHPIKLNEEDKMYVAYEIGTAVEYTHERKIVHQDIKPANILISEGRKKAYLTDWGLSNMKDSLAQFGVAASGSMCGPRSTGTPLYMPPELLLHNERCTTMSDMWSLGLTCLEMFTGSEPWSLKNSYALTGLLSNQERPHALAKLQPHLKMIVEPLVQYDPQSRMNATDLVKCLKSKVDLVKRYGYDF